MKCTEVATIQKFSLLLAIQKTPQAFFDETLEKGNIKAYQKEIVSFGAGNGVVHDSAGLGISVARTPLDKKSEN